MEQARRAIRGLRYALQAVQSWLSLLSCRMQFSGLEVGRNVRLGRGVSINVACGGTLRLGDNVYVGNNAQITADGGKIEIGSDSYVGDGVIIVSAERILIGRDALIAAYATIRDQDHGTSLPGTPYRAQPLETARIAIGDNVWLGAHVTVLKGVTIGDGAVVGANSVVTRDLAPGTLSVGAPARTLRTVADPPR